MRKLNRNRRLNNRRVNEDLEVTDQLFVVKDLETGEVVSDVLTDEETAAEVAQDIADEQGTEVILEAYVRARRRTPSLSESRRKLNRRSLRESLSDFATLVTFQDFTRNDFRAFPDTAPFSSTQPPRIARFDFEGATYTAIMEKVGMWIEKYENGRDYSKYYETNEFKSGLIREMTIKEILDIFKRGYTV